MTDRNLTYREQVLLDVAQSHGLFPSEAKVLPVLLDAIGRKLQLDESETLWHLSTNKELSAYAASVARDVALTG